jgi:hypothetical protein
MSFGLGTVGGRYLRGGRENGPPSEELSSSARRGLRLCLLRPPRGTAFSARFPRRGQVTQPDRVRG